MRSFAVVLGLLALVLPCATPELAAQADAAPAPSVVVVPIRGGIGTTTVALVSRGMRTARAVGARRVVLDIDTMGGLQDAMDEIEAILNTVREGRPSGAASPPGAIRSTAFVRKDAWSAGGYIALACDETYMAPGASIGAIVPVLAGADGALHQIPDEDVRRKVYSALRARVRALVERRPGVGESTLKLAEAMVDPTMRVVEVSFVGRDGLRVTRVVESGELDALVAAGATIQSQREFGQKPPITLTASEALQHGFSSGTYDTLADLMRGEFLVHGDAVVTLEESWSESAVAWLEQMKPILFVLGFLALMVEAKVPGLVIPGVIGVVLIALGLFSSYLVGLADWTEILLFFLGLVFIGIEVFVMPGTLVFGFFGFVAVVLALVLAQQTFLLPGDATQTEIFTQNLVNLLLLVVLVIAGAALFYRFLPRIPYFNRALLVPPEAPATGASTRFARAGAPQRSELLGLSGVATTDLRPAGIVEFGTRRLDVVSTGGFVGRGATVRVVAVDGNRIVVESDTRGEAGEVGLGVLFLLIVIGLSLIVAEVFFVSFGILSVGAAVSLVSAVFLAFTQHGQAFGFLFLAFAAIGAPLCIAGALRVLPNTGLGRKLLLGGLVADPTGAAVDAGARALLGQRGVTVSALRPAGFARIAERRVDVVTRGEMLETGTPIEVVEVEGNRIVVAAARDTAPSS